MKKIIRNCLSIIIVCVMALQLISCDTTEREDDKLKTVSATVVEIEKYGHAVLNVTTKDFMSVGYELGDVVLISLESGEYTMPFYDGYYSNPGNLLLRGTNQEDNIAICMVC